MKITTKVTPMPNYAHNAAQNIAESIWHLERNMLNEIIAAQTDNAAEDVLILLATTQRIKTRLLNIMQIIDKKIDRQI